MSGYDCKNKCVFRIAGVSSQPQQASLSYSYDHNNDNNLI